VTILHRKLDDLVVVRQEGRYAIRELRRAIGTAALACLLLGVTIGGVGALAAVSWVLMWRPLPLAAADRLVSVFPESSGGSTLGFPFPTLAMLAERQHGLESVCGFARGAMRIELGGTISTVPTEAITGACHAQWGVRPLHGRLMTEAESPLDGKPEPVVLVGHGFWRSALGADPNIVGQTLRIEGAPLRIIGVTPPDYRGLYVDEAPALSVPLILVSQLQNVINRAMWAVGRMPPGVTAEAAEAALNVGWREIWDLTNPIPPPPARQNTFGRLRLTPLASGFSDLRDRYRQPLVALIGLALALLILACLNVGALLLARTVARADLLAIQLALGASRQRLACRLLVEASLLMMAALAVALPSAWAMSRWLAVSSWTSTRVRTLQVTPDATVVALMAGLAAVAVVAITVPRLLHVALSRLSIDGSGQRASSYRAARWRRALTACQIGASVVLLFGAALFWTNLQRIRNVDPGYPADALMWTRIEAIPGTIRRDAPDAHLRPIVDALRAAGLGQAGFAARFPNIEVGQVQSTISRRRGDEAPVESTATFDVVSPGFFAAAGIQLLRGRDFIWQETAKQPTVAIVNASLAAALWGNDDPLGQPILLGRPPSQREARVVGVVADASPGDPRLTGVPVYYAALPQSPNLGTTPYLIVRHDGRPEFAERLRSTVSGSSRHFTTRIEAVDVQLERLLVRERLLADLSLAFALIGLAVSAVGLYALLAHAVASRTRELGVRIALGATRERILASVSRESAVLLAIGIGAGVPLAIAAARAVRALLFGVSPTSVTVLVATVAVIVGIGTLATAIPAIRAARCNVQQALRHD
jgi:predicted permease